jgi:8-oxo-dGTP diphosphatase
MGQTHVNREFVEEQIERLTAEYGEVAVQEDVEAIPPDEFPEYVQNAHDGYVGSAYAWVVRRPQQAGDRSETYAGGFEQRERALMILPRGESEWGVPGGGLEGEESFEEAAVRETREEAGVDCEVTDLWHLWRVRWRSEDPDDERVSHTLHVFFDADYVSGQIATQAAEVNGAAWFAEPPARLGEQAARRAERFFNPSDPGV